MIMQIEDSKKFIDFIKQKDKSDREKYIKTEVIWIIEEVLDWKIYTFEKIRVKINDVIMLNLKSVKRI